MSEKRSAGERAARIAQIFEDSKMYPDSALYVYGKKLLKKLGSQVGNRTATRLVDYALKELRQENAARAKQLEVLKRASLHVTPVAVVHQQAVGHGGFHTGALGVDRPDFRWIYDAGAWRKAGKAALNRRTKDLARKVRQSRRPVDLLFLSHFDADHVSGVDALLAGVPVDIAVVPYLTPAQVFGVLAAAAASPQQWSPLLVRALGNPTAWLTGRGVKRVIRLQPGFGGGGTEDERPDGVPIVSEGGGGTPPDRPLRPELQDRAGRPLPLPDAGSESVVEPGLTISVRAGPRWFSDWALVPYVHNISDAVKVRLEAAAGKLLNCDVHDPSFVSKLTEFVAEKKNRAKLRQIYHDKELGSSNATSMSLYAGPYVYSANQRRVVSPSKAYRFASGWLLTGDAELGAFLRRQEWMRFCNTLNPNHIGMLMLPHHGSVANFHADILDAAPHSDLFLTADSADCTRPSKDVVAEIENVRGCAAHINKVTEQDDADLLEISGPTEIDPLDPKMLAKYAEWT